MLGLLVVLFLTVPLAELAVVIAVGQQLGVADTILIMLAVSVVGAVLAKRQGLSILREVQRRLEAGEVPGAELTDGLLVLVAAVLLLTPGFITDAVALLLLLPFVRAGVRLAVRRRFEHRVRVVEVGRRGNTVIDAQWTDQPGEDFRR